MKKRAAVVVSGAAVATVASLAALGLIMAAHPSSASAATACTPTGFYRDGINLTAVKINPTGVVNGVVNAQIDATTKCDIGVYYGPGSTGTVNKATVENARYFGVVNNGGMVTVENSSIHDIGNSPFDGDQHGVAVYWAYDIGASGRIVNNTIQNYQKAGIVVNGVGSSADVRGNSVTGLGPIDYNAQNGIEVGLGAKANVMDNTVKGNSYTGTDTVSGGIVVFGGPYYEGAAYTTNVQIVGNTVVNNDIGIWMTNIDTSANPPTTLTNIQVVNNTISNNGLHNDYYGFGYQAGIADQGDNDKLIHNTISGAGYDPSAYPNAYVVAIDADSSFTNHVKVHANVVS